MKIDRPPRKDHTLTASQRGYTALYQRLRRAALAANPLCTICGQAWATQTHHRDGNAHNNVPENLAAVCERCHREQHR